MCHLCFSERKDKAANMLSEREIEVRRSLLIISLILIVPCSLFSTTTTASVGGTLKIYETITLSDVLPLIFPAQFEGPLASDLINVHLGPPATGIPNIVDDTQGRVGRVKINGTGGTVFAATIASPMSLVNNSSTISAALSLWPYSSYTGTLPTIIGGTVGAMGQSTSIYVKGLILAGSSLISGTYTGSAVFTVTYN